MRRLLVVLCLISSIIFFENCSSNNDNSIEKHMEQLYIQNEETVNNFFTNLKKYKQNDTVLIDTTSLLMFFRHDSVFTKEIPKKNMIMTMTVTEYIEGVKIIDPKHEKLDSIKKEEVFNIEKSDIEDYINFSEICQSELLNNLHFRFNYSIWDSIVIENIKKSENQDDIFRDYEDIYATIKQYRYAIIHNNIKYQPPKINEISSMFFTEGYKLGKVAILDLSTNELLFKYYLLATNKERLFYTQQNSGNNIDFYKTAKNDIESNYMKLIYKQIFNQ